MDSPLFQQGLELTQTDFGRQGEQTCLNCHAPIGVLTEDLALRQKVTWEGITCEYCHSIREISLAGPNPKVKVEFSLVKSGPLKDVSAPIHGVTFSPIYTSAAICAPCHDYQNSFGLRVLATYSEWKNTHYAKEGWVCQSCHMYKVAGDLVDSKIMKSTEAKVNLHQMPGSHSLEQLTKTIKARMNSSHKGGQLELTLEVSNVAAGHYVPTGSPMRQLILEVRVDTYDGKHYRQEKRYRRTVADSEGNELRLEPLAFLKGAKVISDTRLAPGEKRTETFRFAVPNGVQSDVQAVLSYFYSPLAQTELEKSITFLTIRRLVQ